MIDEIVIENDKYRAGIGIDICGGDFEPEIFTAFVRIEGYSSRVDGLCSEYSDNREIAAEGALEAAISHWDTDPSQQTWNLVVRYMRAFYGAELHYFYSDGIRGWYVGTSEGQVDEYESWCNGEVYTVTVEEKVHVTRYESIAHADGTVTADDSSGEEWQELETVGGYIGYKWAEEAARELFEGYSK